MPVPTIVKNIQKSLDVRKKAKQKIDESINLESLNEKNVMLSVTNSAFLEDKPTRLLNEGAIMYEGGKDVRLFIEKGAIQKFYNNLPDDYVGYISLAHIHLFSLPLNLGTWTKQDLEIVDLEDGRQALNVRAHLNDSLHIVQDLKNQEIPLSFSVEMATRMDWRKSFALGFPCIQEIDIQGFSVVGNPANVDSTNVNLTIEGEDEMNLKDLLSGKKEDIQPKEDLNTEKPEEKEVTEEKIELSSDQLTILESFMEKFETLENENKELKEKIAELQAKETKVDDKKEAEKEEKLNSQVEDVLSRLEKLMNGTETSKKEEPTVNPEFGFLGNLEPKKGDK